MRFDEKYHTILSKKRQKNRRLRRASLRRRLRRAAGASAPDPVYTLAMPRDLSRSHDFFFFLRHALGENPSSLAVAQHHSTSSSLLAWRRNK